MTATETSNDTELDEVLDRAASWSGASGCERFYPLRALALNER
jgi:hypothetical protein